MAAPKLDIFKMLAAMDCKDYNFYDNLSDEERKGFSAFLALKWGASVEGSREIQHYYLAATNHYCNKHWFEINKHPKLQWLELCAASPGIGPQRHKWLEMQKKDKKADEHVKKLTNLFPNVKINDIEVLSKLVSKRDIDEYIKIHGDM
jgi:hypothetical protein